MVSEDDVQNWTAHPAHDEFCIRYVHKLLPALAKYLGKDQKPVLTQEVADPREQATTPVLKSEPLPTPARQYQ